MRFSYPEERGSPPRSVSLSTWLLYWKAGDFAHDEELTNRKMVILQDGERSGGEDMWRVAEVTWFVQPGEERAEGRPHRSLLLPRGGGVEGGAELCSLVTNHRSWGNGSQLWRGVSGWVSGKGVSGAGASTVARAAREVAIGSLLQG